MLVGLILMFFNPAYDASFKALAVFIKYIGISASSAIFWETGEDHVHLECSGLPLLPL